MSKILQKNGVTLVIIPDSKDMTFKDEEGNLIRADEYIESTITSNLMYEGNHDFEVLEVPDSGDTTNVKKLNEIRNK